MKLQRLSKIKPGDKNTDGITLERFFDVFDDFIKVKKLEGASPRTISDYSDHIKTYFKRFLEDERIAETEQVNIGLIRNYMGYMQDKELKSSTINIRLRTLRSFIKWMNREEIIDGSISVKLKLVKQEEKKIQIITDLQVKKFF